MLSKHGKPRGHPIDIEPWLMSISNWCTSLIFSGANIPIIPEADAIASGNPILVPKSRRPKGTREDLVQLTKESRQKL